MKALKLEQEKISHNISTLPGKEEKDMVLDAKIATRQSYGGSIGKTWRRK